MKHFVLLAAFCAAAIAQQPGAANGPAADEIPEPARIVGTVRSINGEVIPRANLRLQGGVTAATAAAGQRPANYATSSNAEGNFAFENIVPGQNYRLTAERPGFVNLQYGSRGPRTPSTPINLNAGQVMTDVEMIMTPQAVISGRVTDQTGDPVVNIRVMAVSYGYMGGTRRLTPAGIAVTNDEGDFRISGLDAGRYYLRAEQTIMAISANPTIQVSTGEQAVSNVPTFYPNAEQIRSATPLNVTSGNELRGMDIRVAQRVTYTASGKMVDGVSGAAVSGMLQLVPPDTESQVTLGNPVNRQVVQLPDASFQFTGLVPGTYTIQNQPNFNVNGQSVDAGIGVLEFTIVDQDVTDLVLSLGAGATVTGTITMEDGEISSLFPQQSNAANNPIQQVLNASRGPRVGLVDADAVGLTATRNQVVNPDGSFEITGVPPGRYNVNLSPLPENVYIKSIRFNGQDVTLTPADMTSGAGGQVQILLSDKAADLTGVLRNEDGEVQPGMQVTLWPKTQNPDLIGRSRKSTVSDQNGSFFLPGIRPGEYLVASWDTIEPGITQVPAFLMQFRTDAEELDIAEGSHQAVAIEVIPATKVAAAMENMP